MALDGTYKIVTNSQMGKTEALFHFRTDGETLMGTNDVMGQTLVIQNGKVSENSFDFTEKMESPMGATDFTFKGTYEGDKISGTMHSSMGTTPFEGSRIS